MSSQRFFTPSAVLVIALSLAGLPASQAADGKIVPPAQSNQKVTAVAQMLIDKAEREGPQRVIVGLDSDFVPEGRLKAVAAASQRRRISNSQASVMASLSGLAAIERRRFRHIPFMVLEVGAPALKRLATLPMVVSLEEDRAEPPIMSSSNAIIGSPDAWAAGFEGTGWTVAVLDTGVDKTHPFFATRSKVVSEACYSSTVKSQKSISVCPDGVATSTASGSGLNCPLDVEGCAHGTHVAGSVAGDDQNGPHFGVARSAQIIAIQVFSRFDNAQSFRPCANTPCVLAYPGDQIAGLERVYELRNDFNIAAVNMSLGGGGYTDPAECDELYPSRKAAIDTLRSVGIATVVASGNSGSRDTVSTPACISSAVSVGSTTDGVVDGKQRSGEIYIFPAPQAPGILFRVFVPFQQPPEIDGWILNPGLHISLESSSTDKSHRLRDTASEGSACRCYRFVITTRRIPDVCGIKGMRPGGISRFGRRTEAAGPTGKGSTFPPITAQAMQTCEVRRGGLGHLINGKTDLHAIYHGIGWN